VGAQDGVGYRVLRDADFRYALLPAEASFVGVRFDGSALFNEADFQGDTEFHGASFKGDAWFDQIDNNDGNTPVQQAPSVERRPQESDLRVGAPGGIRDGDG
jgi:Pentapeptide repeats (9 copies)